jgi:uncharacterized protein (TIGR01777 family)
MFMATVLITGGTGFIGRHLCQQLVAENWQVIVLTRSSKAGTRQLPDDVRHKVRLIESLDQLEPELVIDGLINLAGEPLAKGRWTAARKEKFYTSRIGTTEQLCAFFSARTQRPKVVISGSAIGFYGGGTGDSNGDNKPVDESSPVVDNFSHQLCSSWEQSAAAFEALGARLVYLRTGIVLGHGGALEKMLPPFKLALGGPIGDGQQWMPWIHLEDVVALIMHCLSCDNISGPVNATAPNPVSNAEFSRTLGVVLRRPALLAMPALMVKILFGQMGEELLLQGRQVIPRKVQDSGFNFQYPLLQQALSNLLANKK